MKKIKYLALSIVALTLAACGPTASSTSISTSETKTSEKDDYVLKIGAPKGAPALAFYDMANDPNFVTGEAVHLKEEFAKKEYGMIVMEFYTGLRTIKQSNSNYRLARILTGGNLYLVSRSGKTTLPTENDTVLAFGPGGMNGIPYLSLRTLYPQVKKENIVVVPDGAAIQGALVSGTYSAKQETGEKDVPVDYVIIPQPSLTNAMKLLNEQGIKPSVIQCLRDKANKDTNGEQKWVLQAGLFIHEGLYREHKAIFDERLEIIDKNIDTILINPEEVQRTIEEQLPNVNDQKLKFSCPTPMIPKVSKNPKMPNGFGFITKEEYKSVDVQSFLSYLGRSGPENDFTNYMLNK